MGFVSLDNYEDVLSYHMPTNEQIGAIQEVREAAAQMVETILRVARLRALTHRPRFATFAKR
jgi:hypothetical protein